MSSPLGDEIALHIRSHPEWPAMIVALAIEHATRDRAADIALASCEPAKLDFIARRLFGVKSFGISFFGFESTTPVSLQSFLSCAHYAGLFQGFVCLDGEVILTLEPIPDASAPAEDPV